MSGDGYALENERTCAFTPRRATFVASFGDLRAALGEPTGGDGWESSTEWRLRGPGGCKVSVRDHRATSLMDPRLPTVEAFRALPSYEWTIGGDCRLDADDFKTWLAFGVVEARRVQRVTEATVAEK